MIARTVDAVLASAVEAVTVVLGHEADRVRESLSSRNVTFVENPDYAEGLSNSLKRGLANLFSSTDAALICLGDMPRISAAEIDHLIASYARTVVTLFASDPMVSVESGIGRQAIFAEVQDIAGDVGARSLIGSYPDLVIEVEMENDAILLDIDTSEALAKLPASRPQVSFGNSITICAMPCSCRSLWPASDRKRASFGSTALSGAFRNVPGGPHPVLRAQSLMARLYV